MKKLKLKKRIWESSEYFLLREKRGEKIKQGFFNNLALVKLFNLSKKASQILDCGCGDGRIIEILWRKDADFWGTDISSKAIEKGRERLKEKKNVHLKVGDIEKIDFPNEKFDLVYITYTLEHLDSPEKVIEEMMRVTKKGGYLVFIAPNYGSPLCFSPSNPLKDKGLMTQAVKRFIKSHFYLIAKPKGLDWDKVEPKCLKEGVWKSDWDTVVEPYIQTLIYFLQKRGVEVIESNSRIRRNKEKKKLNYGFRLKALKTFKYLVQLLGMKRVPPYVYYGEQLFVVGRKA